MRLTVQLRPGWHCTTARLCKASAIVCAFCAFCAFCIQPCTAVFCSGACRNPAQVGIRRQLGPIPVEQLKAVKQLQLKSRSNDDPFSFVMHLLRASLWKAVLHLWRDGAATRQCKFHAATKPVKLSNLARPSVGLGSVGSGHGFELLEDLATCRLALLISTHREQHEQVEQRRVAVLPHLHFAICGPCCTAVHQLRQKLLLS